MDVLQGIVIFVHVVLSILLIVFVLLHDGRDSGLGAVGGAAGTSGGQHVRDRNLDRITVFTAVLYVITTLALHRLYS
jgi:preprotein translocase subunit SecG